MGFSFYYSIVKHQDRSWPSGWVSVLILCSETWLGLEVLFSARKPVKKGRVDMQKPWEGLTLLHGWATARTSAGLFPASVVGAWGTGPHLPGSAFFCVFCSAQAIPRKQWERGRGMLMRLA